MSGPSGDSIFFLIGSLGIGGAETQLTRLAVEMQRRGRRVTVATIQPTARPGTPQAELVAALRDAGVELLTLTSTSRGSRLKVAWTLTAALRARRPAVLISFLYHADLLARLTRPASRVPVVITSVRNESFAGRHGQGSFRGGIRNLLMRSTNFLADVAVANSAAAREKLIAAGVFRERDLRVIHNCIDTAVFDRRAGSRNPELRASFGVGETDFLWLAVGSLEEQKDFPTLLVAMDHLVRAEPNTRLVIAGEGRQRSSLEIQLADSKLSGHVGLPGIRHDLPALLKSADGLVLSSRWEGLPNVIMEASCAALPVVVTDVGGVRELVRDGQSGLVVQAKDPEALANAMHTVQRMSVEERERMGQTGRTLVEDAFAHHTIANRWDALLEEYASKV
ncbi:MAG: glycosyltransferase [bacterium]|nr:glycosyltransferase [bacterium]